MSLSVIETIRHAEPEWMLTASAASKDGSTLGQQHMSSQTDASCSSVNQKSFGIIGGQIDKPLKNGRSQV